ncbi:ABC transporter substrate-binding protein [Microbacterium sp. X-17]|uniref:ABC transporter substrate-binding protein n=1 Tax=Microbacterium sp. X-17 TaxID=3144404 RepID=UPI0031F5BC8A
MMKTRRRYMWGLAAVAAAALALTGCSGSGGGSGKADSVIVSPIVANPPSLNPLGNETTAYMLRSEFYDSLVRVRTADLQVIPGLAESWDVSDDGLTYTFHLHQGVKWHDGQPFTSTDVKYNLTEAMQYFSPLVTTYEQIASVDTPDDNTAVVHLKTPSGYFLAGLSSLFISPAHIFSGTDIMSNPAWNTPVGTGPFKFESWDQGVQVTGVRNDDYWDGPVNAARIVNPIIPDRNARNVALTSGQANFAFRDAVDPSQLPALEADPKFQVAPMAGYPEQLAIMINQRDGRPLADMRVRQALMQAINRQPMVDRAYFGAAAAAPSNIPRALSWATNPDVDYMKMYPYDPVAAGKLLDEAGYPVGPDGTRFTLTLTVSAEQQPVETSSELLTSDLDKIGVKVNAVTVDSQAQISRMWDNGAHDFDAFIVQFQTGVDPSIILSTLYSCNPQDIGYGNASGVCNQKVDKLFADAAVTTDQAARGDMFRQIDAEVANQLYAVIPFTVTAASVIAASNVTGVADFYSNTGYKWSALGVS